MAQALTKVEIYTKDYCPYCMKAKALLDKKGAFYVEYDVTNDTDKQHEMYERSAGRRTVPQIFVDNKGLGGCDDIHALDNQGKLDAILGIA